MIMILRVWISYQSHLSHGVWRESVIRVKGIMTTVWNFSRDPIQIVWSFVPIKTFILDKMYVHNYFTECPGPWLSLRLLESTQELPMTFLGKNPLVVKNPHANAEDLGSIPGLGGFQTPGATKPLHCSYWSLCALETMLHNKRSHCNKKPTLADTWESLLVSTKTQHSTPPPKIIIIIK